MDASIPSSDDINYLATQQDSAVTTAVGQMTTIIEVVANLQDSSNSSLETIEKQG